MRVDAVLAEQGAQPFDLLGELLDPLGQHRHGLLRLESVQQPEDLLAHPVQVGAQLDQHLRG